MYVTQTPTFEICIDLVDFYWFSNKILLTLKTYTQDSMKYKMVLNLEY